jgi:hypothetical protein
MFDHHFFGGVAHCQIALLFMAAAAKAPPRRASRVPALAGITAAILFAATIVTGGYIAGLELTGRRAEGQVIAIRVDDKDLDREPTYYPVIEFATASAMLLHFEDFGGPSPRYRVGDRVTVLYRGDELPGFAIVDRDRSSNLLLPLLPFGGAVLLGLPLVRRVRSRLSSRTTGRLTSELRGTLREPNRQMMNV